MPIGVGFDHGHNFYRRAAPLPHLTEIMSQGRQVDDQIHHAVGQRLAARQRSSRNLASADQGFLAEFGNFFLQFEGCLFHLSG